MKEATWRHGQFTARFIGPDQYECHVKPPYVRAEWSTPAPMSRDALYWELLRRGAHPQDILDILHEVDGKLY
jgi:hypothetical protein